MDRFKFRVWDKRLNRYLGNNDPTPALLENGNLAYLDDEGMRFYEVEQCTGLKDKNGKLIYEGDLLETYNGKIGKIEFKDATFVLTPINEDNAFSPQDWSEDCVVIGNIHENKELLDE